MKKEKIIQQTLNAVDQLFTDDKVFQIDEDIFPSKIKKILWTDMQLSTAKYWRNVPYQITYNSIEIESSLVSILNEQFLEVFPDRDIRSLSFKNRVNWKGSKRVCIGTGAIFVKEDVLKIKRALENSLVLFFEKYESRVPYFSFKFKIEEKEFRGYLFQNGKVFLNGEDISDLIKSFHFFKDLTACSLRGIFIRIYRYSIK